MLQEDFALHYVRLFGEIQESIASLIDFEV